MVFRKENQEKLVESVHELLSYPRYTPTSIIGHRKAKKLEPHINFKGNENIVFSEADGAIDPKGYYIKNDRGN